MSAGAWTIILGRSFSRLARNHWALAWDETTCTLLENPLKQFGNPLRLKW